MKRKAKLVGKGFTQTPGEAYFEVFSPVVRHTSLLTLLALVVESSLKMRHLDVYTAILNGDLPEKVWYGATSRF